MNDKSLSMTKLIVLLLFVITSMYGFVSLSEVSFLEMLKIYKNFSIDNILTGNTLFFTQTFFIALFILNPKKFGIFFGTSFVINSLIIYLYNLDIKENITHILNFSVLAGTSGFITDYIKNKKERMFYNYGLIIGIVPIFYGYFIINSLNFMKYVLPNTNDIQAIFIDSFYHIPKSVSQYYYFINDYIEYKSIAYEIITKGYNSITLGIILLSIWEYKNKKYHTNTILTISVLLILGIFLYILFPIMGPKYLQLSLESIKLDKDINWIEYIGVMISGSEFPRNGMPSMHFGLTLFTFLNSKGLHWSKRILFLIFFIITAIATIVLGEHYFIDWIGALPVVIIGILISDTHLTFKEKQVFYIRNIINLVIWYIFLWYGISKISNLFECIDCSQFNITMTILLYFISILTIINFILSYIKIYKLGQENLNNIDDEKIDIIKALKIKFTKKKLTEQNKISILFVMSGFAGLMYQVIFGKMLGTTFGSTSIAIYIILATYMMGLSLGAWFGGKIKNNTPSILKYAICESLIAIYCAMTPIIFKILDSTYIYIVQLTPENNYFSIITKIILGVIGLIIPTILMGMTTPILLREFNKENSSGISLAKLYTLNTLGAAIGSILSGYILIQFLGIQNSIYITVLLNLIIAGVGISLFKNKYEDKIINKLSKEAIIELFSVFKFKLKNTNTTINYKKYLIPNSLLFLSGLITMIMETIYVHGLAIVVGNSTYVFSIMLFTFLLGLSFGGHLGKEIISRQKISTRIIGYLEVLLGLSIYISYNLIDKVPNYFSSFGNSIHINTFESREFLKFVVCFGIMILPTIITGIIYTLSMALLTNEDNEEHTNELVGKGLSINTIGNILGIFIGGFIFINELQLQGSFKVLSCLTIIIGLLLNIKNKKILFINSLILILIICQNFSLNMKEVTSGSNVYFNKSSRGEVVEFKESIDGGLTSVNKMKLNDEEILTLLTNGKFQGNNNAESVAQGGFAMAPMMHMNNIENSKTLVLGYGTGMTTRAIHDAGVKSIDLVDLSQDILNLGDKYFKNINHDVRKNENVKTHITDGRNFLKLTSNKYDLISMEISSIWFSGASYLYNQEFYKIAKEKMTDNGILQQWVQMHHMNPNDFNIILNTIRNEFKYVSVYYIGGQGIVVATNSELNKDPIDKTIKSLNNNKKLNEMKNYYENDFYSIIKKKLLNSDETTKYLTALYGKHVKYFTSTDDNLYLEYKTPKGNVLKIDTEKEIIKLINKKLNK